MGHCIMHSDFPENTTKEQIKRTVFEKVRHSGDGYGTTSIQFFDNKVFESCDEASDFVDKATGYYEGVAVKFYDYTGVTTTKVDELRKKLAETNRARDQYTKEHSVKSQKAAYIGCPQCGSKLNRERLMGERCPLCHTDLRSQTTLDRLDSYKTRVDSLYEKIQEELKKNKSKAKIRWLVKWEYHC